MRALALLLVLAGSALAADELRLPPVTRTTFENGLRVAVAEYHELPLVEFYLIVGAGAAQDPLGKDGLAALTAGTLTEGTEKLSAQALARAIESLGGRLDAAGGTDGTTITAEFLSKDFATGLDLLRQVLLEPRAPVQPPELLLQARGERQQVVHVIERVVQLLGRQRAP